MKHLATVLSLLLIPVSLDAQNLDVTAVDGRVSIHAAGAPLGMVLAELDRAAGTESTLPDEMFGDPIHVWFDGLPTDEAIRKLFEGLQVDYVLMGRTRIVVTSRSESLAASQRPFARNAAMNAAALPGTPGAAVYGGRAAMAPGMINPFQMASPAAVHASTDMDEAALQRAMQAAQAAYDAAVANGDASFGFFIEPAAPFGDAPERGGANAPAVAVPGRMVSPFTRPVAPGQAPPPSLAPAPAAFGPPPLFGNTSPVMLELNRPVNPPAAPPVQTPEEP